MKKIISLLLCTVLLLACSAAFAGEEAVVDISGRFQIKGTLPDGCQLSILAQDALTLEGEIRSSDPAAPVLQLYVSFNETYEAKNTLNDLTESELDAIRQSFLEEYTVEFSRLDTASGTPLLVVQESREATDFLDFYTIFHGHEIELWLSKPIDADDPSLEEAQLAAWTDFARTLEFIPLQ